ncbi:MAG: hypothetical protein COB02_07035 [Candidatus Cloacimonadota bacterium]|nr:MAG: hypothetical protein COB02_07035 [Candidatus Cloacimonadota bacterium]
MDGRPFENKNQIFVILPTDFNLLSEIEIQEVLGYRKLLEANRFAIEGELGAKLVFDQEPNIPNCSKWYIGPYSCNPEISKLGLTEPSYPQLFLDRHKSILVTHGKSVNEVMECFSYLRSLIGFKGGIWDIKDCSSTEEAIERVKREVKISYPSFKLRNLCWDEICEKHIPLVRNSSDPIPAFQSWLAELNDAHTWVRPFPPHGELPYDLCVKDNIGIFYQVPTNSLGWKLGVRSGYELLNQPYKECWNRTAASIHSKPWVVGKRILSSITGTKRKLKAKSPEGKIIVWEEEPTIDRWNPTITWKKLNKNNGYIRVQAWILGKDIENIFDRALEDFKDCSKLIIDLRANPGGNLTLAHQIRNRFLKKEKTIGYIQNTLPNGSLSKKHSLLGYLAPPKKRWNKKVVFITDALTYSSSEDVLLGLQGQENIKVIGQKSGGGSGRVRIIRLLPGYRLTISTALTFDVKGNCVENSGIQLDYEYNINSIGENDKQLFLFAMNL